MVSLNEIFFISVGLTVESHNKWECAPTFFRGKGIGGGYISLSQEWERGGRLFKTWPVILCLLNHFYSINSIVYFFMQYYRYCATYLLSPTPFLNYMTILPLK